MDFCHRTAMRDDGTVAAPAPDRSSTSWTGPRVLGSRGRCGGVPAGWHRHRQRLDRRPRRAPRLGDLQPRRQGDVAALHLLRHPRLPAGRRVRQPGPRGQDRAAARGRLRPPHRQGRRTPSTRLEPDERGVPAADDRVRRRSAAGRGEAAGVHPAGAPRRRRLRHPGSGAALHGAQPVGSTGGRDRRRLDVRPDRHRGSQRVPDAGVRGPPPSRRTAVRAPHRPGVRHRSPR